MANPTPEEQEREERELHRQIGVMKDDTEREIMRDAFEQDEPEDDSDRSLEEPEDDIAGGLPEEEQQADSEDEQQDGEPEAEPQEEEAEPQQRPQRDEQSERFVPSYRLREEREARERLERELAETRARAQQPYQPPPPPQPPPPRPDLFVDPDAHADWNMQRTLQAARMQHTELSLAAAAEEYGPDYQYVYQTLQAGVQRNDPAAHQAVAAILGSANPGRALMRWGDSLLQERQDREEQWLREQARERWGIDVDQLEQRRAGQSATRQATPPRRGMPSLNSAAGNGRVMARERYDQGPLSDRDEDIFNDVFSTPRR